MALGACCCRNGLAAAWWRQHRAALPWLTPALLQPYFAELGESSSSEIATGNPLVDLLVAVQRGVLMAAGKMGEVRLARDTASVTRAVFERWGQSSAVRCCLRQGGGTAPVLQAAPKLCSPYIRFAFSRPGVHASARLLLLPAHSSTGVHRSGPLPARPRRRLEPHAVSTLPTLWLPALLRRVAACSCCAARPLCTDASQPHLIPTSSPFCSAPSPSSPCSAGMDGRPGATTAGAAVERPAQHFQRAVLKVACAVAVLVLTRRIALARLVL